MGYRLREAAGTRSFMMQAHFIQKAGCCCKSFHKGENETPFDFVEAKKNFLLAQLGCALDLS